MYCCPRAQIYYAYTAPVLLYLGRRGYAVYASIRYVVMFMTWYLYECRTQLLGPLMGKYKPRARMTDGNFQFECLLYCDKFNG